MAITPTTLLVHWWMGPAAQQTSAYYCCSSFVYYAALQGDQLRWLPQSSILLRIVDNVRTRSKQRQDRNMSFMQTQLCSKRHRIASGINAKAPTYVRASCPMPLKASAQGHNTTVHTATCLPKPPGDTAIAAAQRIAVMLFKKSLAATFGCFAPGLRTKPTTYKGTHDVVQGLACVVSFCGLRERGWSKLAARLANPCIVLLELTWHAWVTSLQWSALRHIKGEGLCMLLRHQSGLYLVLPANGWRSTQAPL